MAIRSAMSRTALTSTLRRRSDHRTRATLRPGSIPASALSPTPTTIATAITMACSLISRDTSRADTSTLPIPGPGRRTMRLAYPTAVQSAAVLWAVHFRCAQSLLAQLQLFAQRLEWRQGSVGVLTGGGESAAPASSSPAILLPGSTSTAISLCARILRVTLPPVLVCESRGWLCAGSGDYNADGNNLDYPDATSYSQPTNNKAWLTGAIPKTTLPFQLSVKGK